MRIEDFKKLLPSYTENELLELIQANRRRQETLNVSKIKEIRKKTKKNSLKDLIGSLSPEDKEKLIESMNKKKEEK